MSQSIKKQLTKGVFFTAIAKYSNMVISLVVTAILSRILSPEEFGVVAIATVIIAFFGMFTEIGIAPAIIQNKTFIFAAAMICSTHHIKINFNHRHVRRCA